MYKINYRGTLKQKCVNCFSFYVFPQFLVYLKLLDDHEAEKAI